MPVRPRRTRKSRRALTLQLDLALTLGPNPRDHDLDDDLLREVYLEHREHLLAQCLPGTRPWAWWRFEAGVPDKLRARRDELLVVDDGCPDALAELEQARATWLAEQETATVAP